MKNFDKYVMMFVSLFALVLVSGCGEEKGTPPPEPLAVEEAPSTLEEAFANSTGELKTMADEAVRFLRVADYPRALVSLQKLSARTDLTSSQRGLTAKALMTADQKVSESAQSGNKEAEKLQQYREFTK